MVPNLGGYFVGSAEAGARATATAASRAVSAAATASPNDLEVGAHFGGSLLGCCAGILVLCAIAPDGGLLLAQESHIARGGGNGAA
jgi:hypothetical protein